MIENKSQATKKSPRLEGCNWFKKKMPLKLISEAFLKQKNTFKMKRILNLNDFLSY